MRRSVNSVIADADGRFLLQMRDGRPGICHPLLWNFFGGALHEGEPPIAGAIRETAEEIGIQITEQELDLLGCISEHAQEVHVVRLSRPVGCREVRLGEGAGFGYFTVSEMMRISCTPMTHQLAKRFLGADTRS